METPPRIIGDISDYFNQFGGDKYFGYACDAMRSLAIPVYPDVLTSAAQVRVRIGDILSSMRNFVNVSSNSAMINWRNRNRDESDNFTPRSTENLENLCGVLQLVYFALTTIKHRDIANSGIIQCALSDAPENLSGILYAYIKAEVGQSELEGVLGLLWADEVKKRIDSYTLFFGRYHAMIYYFSFLSDAIAFELRRRQLPFQSVELEKWLEITKGFYRLEGKVGISKLKSDLSTYSFLVEEICRLRAVLQIWNSEVILDEPRAYYLSDTTDANTFIEAIKDLQRDDKMKKQIEKAIGCVSVLAARLGERLFGMESVPVDIHVRLADSTGEFRSDPVLLRVLYKLDENGCVCGWLPLHLHHPGYVVQIPKEATLQVLEGGDIVKDSAGWPMLFFDFKFIDIITGKVLYLNEIYRYPEHLKLTP